MGGSPHQRGGSGGPGRSPPAPAMRANEKGGIAPAPLAVEVEV